uniref:Uncharacterized protein n=1 Tax=Coprothermobacter proteolyticus (strain ATCC 35245 / DSM 5265 / OCM 4 / BT) TaxID=309798 RepID=B5Y7Y0_COPPD
MSVKPNPCVVTLVSFVDHLVIGNFTMMGTLRNG